MSDSNIKVQRWTSNDPNNVYLTVAIPNFTLDGTTYSIDNYYRLVTGFVSTDPSFWWFMSKPNDIGGNIYHPTWRELVASIRVSNFKADEELISVVQIEANYFKTSIIPNLYPRFQHLRSE
jgi:hypothetical protein